MSWVYEQNLRRTLGKLLRGIPHSSVGKESACNAGDPSLIPGLGRSTGKGIGHQLQHSWASLVAQLVKKYACNAGDPSLIPGLGRSPGEENGYPLQYPCLWNPMDRGAWWAIVHWVTKKVGYETQQIKPQGHIQKSKDSKILPLSHSF